MRPFYLSYNKCDGGRFCALSHLTWQPCPDTSYPRHLWHFKATLVPHTVALWTTKGGLTLPRGAGNFRWIILGPGKPVFNRTYCLNLATPSRCHCVLIGCACVTPLGKSLSGMLSIYTSTFFYPEQLSRTNMYIYPSNSGIFCLHNFIQQS